MIKKFKKNKFPDNPGVYFFKKRGRKVPLYIGKATSLRDRIASYFNNKILTSRGPRIGRMIEIADSIETIKTDSVLEALLLETEFIKKFKPVYNAREKDDKSFNYVVITRDTFPEVRLVREKEFRQTPEHAFIYVFGPFPQSGELKDALKIIRKIFPWRDKKCVPGQGKLCFSRQIGLCPGVCTGEITQKEYKQSIKYLANFMSGKKNEVIQDFERTMKIYAKREEFEKAREIRDKIFALTHIQDIALLKRNREDHGFRIEAYDIAHLFGKESVGAVAVVSGGEPMKNEYRKFKIRGDRGVHDTGNLREVLERRFRHLEWPLPDCIVVDGGIAQVNVASSFLKSCGVKALIVGVVKDDRHKPKKLIGDVKAIKEHKEGIIMANSEAHRFAISYHRRLRLKTFRGV